VNNQYLWDRISGRELNLRAADADRERIADRLRKSHAEGRLDMDEFQERLERCYQSKTLGELAALVKDLPRESEQPSRSVGPWRPSRWLGLPLMPILIALVVVSAAAGHHHAFWLWIPLGLLFWRMSWWRHRRRPAGSRRGWDEWI
jgi:hypothetical protein